jgi:hypothetical protein
MIHPLVKIITVDNFFPQEEAIRLSMITNGLQYRDFEFGQQIENFNMVPENANELFSTILNTDIEVDQEQSGVFRKPVSWIHFEGFDGPNEWIFACALHQSTFNVYEHQSGAITARDGYEFAYKNLFEWDLKINYILSPGQGVLFRPWLFHTFDAGIIQVFRLREKNDDQL